MSRQTLCSGGGGSPSRRLQLVTCPVCGRWWDKPWKKLVVPRHFIQAGGA